MAKQDRQKGADLATTLRENGFVHMRGVVDASVVHGFVEQIRLEMSGVRTDAGGSPASLRPTSDRTMKQPVVLDDPTTWPKKGARRVIETAPVCTKSTRDHWEMLHASLAPALDLLMGHGCWELPFNTLDSSTRHFYCPTVMPEVQYPNQEHNSSLDCDGKSKDQHSHQSCCAETAPAADVSLTREARPVLLESWKDEIRRAPFTSEIVDAPNRWQPVSRRRFRGKGWHVDIGPGFSTDAIRTIQGHPYQGLVVLILLSDWLPGGGGTVMVPGSQEWVRERLTEAGTKGMVHQELNAFCVQQMVEKVRSGRVVIPCPKARQQLSSFRKRKSPATGTVVLHQICGKAGDVVFMHPWLIHSGTTNLRSRPRLMANGMVRVKDAVFKREGCRILVNGEGDALPPKKKARPNEIEARHNAAV